MADFQEIEVNGEILEFPADMSDAQIAAAIQADSAPSLESSPLMGYKRDERVRFGPKDFLRTLGGVGEGILSTVTGGLAAPIAGLGGLMSLGPHEGQGVDTAVDNISKIQSALTYQPRMREGQLAAEGISLPFRATEAGAGFLGENAAQLTGSPAVGAGIKSTALTAPALIPAIKGGIGRPSGRGQLSHQQAVLERAQSEGYVVPTSSANPQSIALGAAEGMAGKPRMQQVSSYRNQAVTNEIAARELGLPEGTVITRETLAGVRNKAGQAYQVLDNSGTVVTNVVFRRDLAKAVQDLKQASKDFPALAKKDSPVQNAVDLAQGLNKPTFRASSVAPVTRILRNEASAAYKAGQAEVGNAYRSMAKAIEDAAEAHLTQVGDPVAIQAFRDARQMIAKTYSVERALAADGIVSAPRLAGQLKKGEPLSGGLRNIAEFSEQFPRSTRVITEPPIQTGRLSSVLGVGGGAGFLAAGEPASAAAIGALTFGGPLMRSLLLSKTGQSTLGKPRAAPPAAPAAMSGTLLSGLLSDPPK